MGVLWFAAAWVIFGVAGILFANAKNNRWNIAKLAIINIVLFVVLEFPTFTRTDLIYIDPVLTIGPVSIEAALTYLAAPMIITFIYVKASQNKNKDTEQDENIDIPWKHGAFILAITNFILFLIIIFTTSKLSIIMFLLPIASIIFFGTEYAPLGRLKVLGISMAFFAVGTILELISNGTVLESQIPMVLALCAIILLPFAFRKREYENQNTTRGRKKIKNNGEIK